MARLTSKQAQFLHMVAAGDANGPYGHASRLTARTLIMRGLIESHSDGGWFSHYTITDAGMRAIR